MSKRSDKLLSILQEVKTQIVELNELVESEEFETFSEKERQLIHRHEYILELLYKVLIDRIML